MNQFVNQLSHSHNNFDESKTLKFKLNEDEKEINYQKIFKKFEEHEIERIIDDNLKH